MKTFTILLFCLSLLIVNNCEKKEVIKLTTSNSIFLDQIYQADLNREIEINTKQLKQISAINPNATNEIETLKAQQTILKQSLKASKIRFEKLIPIGPIGPIPIGPCVPCPVGICCPDLNFLFLTPNELQNFKAVYLNTNGEEIKTIKDKNSLTPSVSQKLKGFALPLKLKSATAMTLTMKDVNNKLITINIGLD